MKQVRLKRIPNACSTRVYHIYEGNKFLATVLPWTGGKYVLVDEDNVPCGFFDSPMQARSQVAYDRKQRMVRLTGDTSHWLPRR